MLCGNNEKHFDLINDKKLSFDVHIKYLVKEASQKLNTLARISSFLTVDLTFLLISLVVKPKINCYPLRWMFYSLSLNNPGTHYPRKCN